MIIAIYNQMFIEKDKETLSKEIADEEYAKLQMEFENIFDNSIKNANSLKLSINKNDDEKELVYTEYKNTEKKDDKYDLDVNLPYINIKNDTIEKYNKEIKNIFQDKAESILTNEDSRNVIYTVNYVANVSDNILSIIIHSTLKEGTRAQRDIIKTYNYNLKNNKEVNVKDILNIKGISVSDANNKIHEKIKEEQSQIEDLANLGYSVYNRDVNSSIYKIENVEEFYFSENSHLYIIFAYGNDNLTNEKDVVIF